MNGWQNIGNAINSELLQFDATVGIGGDYPETDGIYAAVQDGKFRLKIISNITETKEIEHYGIILFSDVKNDGSLNKIFLRNRFVIPVANKTFISYIENIEFITDVIKPFERGKFYLKNVKLSSDFTSLPAAFGWNNFSEFYGDYINFNLQSFHIELITNAAVIDAGNVIISGNGNLSRGRIIFKGIINYLKIEGDFTTGSNHELSYNYGTINKISDESDTNTTAVVNRGIINSGNLKRKSQSFDTVGKFKNLEIDDFYVYFDNAQQRNEIIENCKINNFHYNNGAFVTTAYYHFKKFQNNEIANDAVIGNSAYSDRIRLNPFNCKFKKLTVNWDNAIIKNSIFDELIINGKNCSVDNCKVTNGTITVNPSADKTILTNNRTLTPIVDNGTNTEMSNNVLI